MVLKLLDFDIDTFGLAVDPFEPDFQIVWSCNTCEQVVYTFSKFAIGEVISPNKHPHLFLYYIVRLSRSIDVKIKEPSWGDGAAGVGICIIVWVGAEEDWIGLLSPAGIKVATHTAWLDRINTQPLLHSLAADRKLHKYFDWRYDPRDESIFLRQIRPQKPK